jgi:cell wall-associated NlpC family hydrolase
MVKTAAALGAAAAALPLALIVLVTAAGQPSAPAPAPGSPGLGAGAAPGAARALGGAPAPAAEKDIPPAYLALYMDAAQTCPGLPWTVLAAIGTVESGNGQARLPGVRSGANYAGAEGPMQFLPATFAAYAVNASPGQPLSPYDPADAVYTAAAMLCASGARGGSPSGIEQAVFAYNHAGWYVQQVMARAGSYAAQGTDPGASQRSAAVAAIAFARAQLGKPYQWGAQGPGAYDCSGLVWAAYAAAGVHIARTTYQWQQDGPAVPLSQIQPGDLLFYAGSDGTATSPGHVVMYLGGGQVIQAPHTGTDVQVDPLDRAGVIVATRPSGLTASS